MLTYLINVTNDLMLLAITLGITGAFIDCFFDDTDKNIYRIGIAAGFLIAGVRAYITNTRRLVKGWKVGVYGYLTALASFVILLALFAVFSKVLFKKEEGKKKTISERIICIFIILLMDSYIYGALPNVYAYPFKFDTGGNGLLSTDFLFRLGGYLSGILASLAVSISAFKIMSVASKKGKEKLLALSFMLINIVYIVFVFAKLMLVLTPRKIIDSIPLFNFAAFSNNHSQWFAYAGFVILSMIAVWIFIGSSTIKEPYATKAQHRKQKALWRTGKRFSIVMAVGFLLTILCSTWFVKLNTVVIREAPVEDPILIKNGAGEDSELKVALESVSDGHLHRFGYTTSEGHPVRFIVILKQENTNNYGIGLDACEICGEAGYYENSDGQIVCKKCGVVMNTTTIGMKGGCNPIIIDYDIDEGYITVPVEEMVKNQARFKK